MNEQQQTQNQNQNQIEVKGDIKAKMSLFSGNSNEKLTRSKSEFFSRNKISSDNILTQKTTATTKTTPSEATLFSCDICIEETNNPLECNKCHQRACFDCFRTFAITNIKSQRPPSCLHCKKDLSYSMLKQILVNDSNLLKQFQEFSSSNILKENTNQNIIYCGNPDCSSLQSAGGESIMVCRYCQSSTCVAHESLAFSKSLIRLSSPSFCCRIGQQEVEGELNLEGLEDVKKCPECNVNIEKNGGCMHMTCRCKHEFFWCCLRPYRVEEQARLHRQLCVY